MKTAFTCLFAAVLLTGCNVTLPKWVPEIAMQEMDRLMDDAVKDDPAPVIPPSNVVAAAVDTATMPCASLPITATVSDVKHGKGKTTWTMTGTDKWDKKSVKKTVQGMTYLYVWRDDKWKGGKFDWFRPGQTSKGHENIEGGYMDVNPVKGDKVAFGLLDIHKAQRSNFVEGVWP